MRYKVTMPRITYFLVFLFGLTGVIMSLITEPTFAAERSVKAFSTGRWAALVLTAAVALFSLKGVLLPRELFACDHIGVSIPGLSRLVEWQHVRALDKSQIRVGTNTSSRRAESVINDAVRIEFDESVELNDKGLRGSHGRATDKRTYVFSTGVTRESVEQVIARIEALRGEGERH